MRLELAYFDFLSTAFQPFLFLKIDATFVLSSSGSCSVFLQMFFLVIEPSMTSGSRTCRDDTERLLKMGEFDPRVAPRADPRHECSFLFLTTKTYILCVFFFNFPQLLSILNSQIALKRFQ